MDRNDYGVETPDLALNLTKTTHGLSISLPTGTIIGRIQDWAPTFAERALSNVYELNRRTFGRPIDIVPGVESGRSISVNRVEVWEDELEVAFGAATSEMVDLCDQTEPFDIVESLFRGSTAYRSWRYKGCWFASKSLSGMSAEGDAKLISDATINYVIRQKI